MGNTACQEEPKLYQYLVEIKNTLQKFDQIREVLSIKLFNDYSCSTPSPQEKDNQLTRGILEYADDLRMYSNDIAIALMQLVQKI